MTIVYYCDVRLPFPDIVFRILTLNVTSSLYNVTEVAVIITYNLILRKCRPILLNNIISRHYKDTTEHYNILILN